MPHPDTTGELLGPLLEATSIGELLTAYQALPRPIALSEVAQHVGSNHPRLRLLAWRIEAGPPGVELPAPEVATARLADPRSVRPEDVGALVLIPHALPVDPSALADVLTSWLDAAPTSLPHMTAAIAVSALLACILAGAAERADGLISALRRRELPQTSESVTFDALASGYQRVREHASSPTLRVVAAILWRALALPSLPDLVAHIDFEHVDRRTLVAIAKSGAGQPNSLLANAADHLLRHETANQLDDHPLVRDLRRLARENMSIADLHARALDLPPGLVHWATLRIRSDDAGPARLAAWALYGQGRLSAAGLALLLMGRPHAEDLDFIAKHSPTEEARATASRLVQDLGDSPPDVAAALVRFIFGRWDDDSIAILREKLAPLVHAGDRIHGEALDAARRFLDLDARMAHEAEAATAGVERFLEQVASIRAYFSPTESDAALIDRLLARLDEPYLEPAFFDVVLAKAESLGQPDRLLACLAAHRWAHSNARLRTYAPALAEMVTRDIERLGALHLFPDRVHLLTEVIAACAESERAEYICRRGCTHATLASSDPRHAGPAEADFEQAAALARRHHLVEIEIWALTSHLRLLQTPNAHFNARSVNLVERLRELECLTQDPTALADIRTVVADRLLGQTSPDDIEGARLAIEHLRTVVRDTDAATVLGQQARERLAQELVNYGTPAERREALALARATFENRLHPDSEELSAPAHFTLASAFLATPENSDSAKEHLDAALRGYSRAGNRSGIQATRHLLAEFYASRDELAAGRTHADIAFQLATEHGDHGAILAATVSLLRLAPAGPHDPRIARAVSILPSGHKVRLRVHQALALAEAGASIDPCVADLLEFWSASSPRTDAATLAAAITLAHNHPDRLAGPLLDAALRWSERIDHPTLRARLLIHTGRTEEACSLLRSVTTDAETGQLRTSAALLLLAALPSDRADERARLCDDIEPRLDFNAASEAAALFDLAQGLLQTSEHDPGRLQRAWAAAEAAAKHLPANLHATSLRQRWTIRAQQIIAEVKESSERTAELAEWLVLAERPSGSVDEHILSAAFALLLFGRLTHPLCVDAANRLLPRLQHPDGRAALLWQRIAWIRGQADAPMAIEGKLPFDDAPPWLVDIVRHDAPSHDAKVASDELDLAGRALQLRRDRAEAILDWLLAEGRACDPDALHAMVTSYGERVAKPRHLKRIQRIRAGRAEFDRIAREFQAHYSNGKWGNGTELQRLGEQLLSLAASPEEKIRALHAVGVERMSAFRAGAPRDALDRSRVALTEASAMLRTGDYMPDLAVAVLVSTGNTWRLGDDADPDKALEHYSEAESLNPSEAHFQGQLHKVIADALILRSKPEDLAQARKHIDRSLEARRDGPLRMETLLTAVDLELADRVSPRAKCLERAIRYFEEALTLCPDSVARALVRDRVIPIAAEHRRLAHDSTAAKRILDTASARFPDLAVEIAAAQRGAAEAIDRVSIDEVLHILRHPACALVAEATFDLDPETILEPRMRERVSGVLTHRPESPPTAELRDRVRHLEGESVPEKQPGALVATALLLSKLAAAGEDVIARARRTADLAEAAISSIPDPAVRAFLHLHLSSFWAPSDHNSNPTRDFKRGAEYLESALIEIPSDARIRGDFLLRHARATRYRTDGGALQHMRRAEGLYHEALALAKAMGDEISANQILFNLQELAVALGRGGETENLQQSVETTREIAEWSGGSSFLHLIALARDYTLLGCRQGGHEAIQSLQEGQRVFERLFREHRLPSGTWEDARNYEVMGRVELALRSGNADRAVALWRDRLAEQGNEVGHARRGITLHNLADTLTRVGRTYHEALEAIRLCDEAIRLRFEVGDPQHLWETHHLRGDATRCALEHAHGEVSQAARQDLWTKGVKTYESAIRLARELGKGERLLRSAIGLGMLALRARTISAMLPLAETCWTAIDEARQTLPYAERLAFQETSLATAMGARILQMAGQQDVDGELGGRRGVIVAQWILRAAGGQQRRLGARWRRPEETPDQLWRDWLRALKTDDVREIGRVAESIQAHAPFLSAEVDFAGVERWLAKEPASAGIVVLPCSAGHISAVFTLEEGQLAVTCKLLEGPVDSPREPQELFLSDHPFTSSKYTQMLARAKQRVVVPLRQLLPSTTKNLLWHGSGDLRLISPHDLWPGLAVTSALDFALKGAAEPHHAATAIVIADPDTADARIPQSVETGEHLARVLSDSTPRRLRFSRGATYGSHLEITARGLIDAPADPDGVLEDLKECSRVVMMCHGGFSDSSDPVLFLLDERGNRSELNLDRIAADPGAFVGATVILLACWAGQVGPRNYQVEGFPAVFLACGARRVIAPLWPVYVHAAVEVGTSLLRALETGRRPDEALAALIRQYQRSGQRDLLDSARAFVIYEA